MNRRSLVVHAAAILLAGSFLRAATLNHPAPKFSLKNSRQETRALADYKGKVVFINFWASWCAPCQLELPELNQLAADYKGKKVKILAINVDETRTPARKLLTKLALADAPLEILWDPKSKTVSAYNIEGMPSSFIVDQQGIIQFTHVGFRSQDPQTWRREIDRLLIK